MGFNSAFKGLKMSVHIAKIHVTADVELHASGRGERPALPTEKKSLTVSEI
jgi:hypothetical protein